LVTAANVGERAGGQQVLKRVKQSQAKDRLYEEIGLACANKLVLARLGG
jgi:hypothetical protein